MLCKRTYKNQVTIPKKIMENFGDVEYFEARAEADKITLMPVRISPIGKISLSKIREKISALGLSEKDIEEAINRGRKK